MVKGVLKKIACCFKSSVVLEDGGGGQTGPSEQVDGIWWTIDYGVHAHGDFSIAMVQANAVLEDQCEIQSGILSKDENGPQGTFVGIYDGHAGPETAWFVKDRLFENLKRYTSENDEMSDTVIRQAFLNTEEEFISSVESEWLHNPRIASAGSCCLTGTVCNGMLYIANAGDSRAVLAREVDKSANKLTAHRVSEEHNVNIESIRNELQSLHPNDPNIVVFKNNIWRVRGLIQVSRAIGDVYLKRADFNRPPLLPKFILSEPLTEPILKAEPTMLVQKLTPEDQFLIFASDGLWDNLGDQEAVDLVKRSPRNGIAKELVKAALVEAGRKLGMSYSELEKVDKALRRRFHDDITVIVLFLNDDITTSAGAQASSSDQASSSVPTSSGGIVKLSVKSPIFPSSS